MAGKIPLKTAVIIFLYCGIFIILSACIVPVDMDGFFKEGGPADNFITNTVNKPSTPTPPQPPTPPVEDIVNVDDKTGDGLKGGDRKIDNLRNDRYYMVEKEIIEVDEDGNPVYEEGYPKYVTDQIKGLDKGILYEELQYITKIKDGSINGSSTGKLINLHTYTVRAAVPFQNSLIKYKNKVGGGTIDYLQIKGGVLEVTGIKTKGEGVIDISSILHDDGDYEAIALNTRKATSPWLWNDVKTSGWDSLELEGPDTDTDYVFVNKKDLSDFKVLRVNIKALDTVINGVIFTITFNYDDKAEGKLKADGDKKTIDRGTFNGNSKVILTLESVPGSTSWSGVEWNVGGTAYSSGSPHISGAGGNILTINNDTDFWPVLSQSYFDVFVTAKLGTVPYEGNVRITVTGP